MDINFQQYTQPPTRCPFLAPIWHFPPSDFAILKCVPKRRKFPEAAFSSEGRISIPIVLKPNGDEQPPLPRAFVIRIIAFRRIRGTFLSFPLAS